ASSADHPEATLVTISDYTISDYRLMLGKNPADRGLCSGPEDSEGGRGHGDRVAADRDTGAGGGQQPGPGPPERQRRGAWAEVGRDPEPAARHDQPSPVLVIVGVHPVEPRVGQLGLAAAQRDQLPVPGEQLAVARVVPFGPVQF